MSVLMDTRVGCYGVVVEDGRLLLAHWNEGGMVAWTLPGGGLDPGEQPEGCVVRELREETGYDVTVGRLLGVHVVEIPAERRIAKGGGGPLRLVRLVYRARVLGGELRNETDGTTDETRWVALDEVAGLDRVDLVDVAIQMLEA